MKGDTGAIDIIGIQRRKIPDITTVKRVGGGSAVGELSQSAVVIQENLKGTTWGCSGGKGDAGTISIGSGFKVAATPWTKFWGISDLGEGVVGDVIQEDLEVAIGIAWVVRGQVRIGGKSDAGAIGANRGITAVAQRRGDLGERAISGVIQKDRVATQGESDA